MILSLAVPAAASAATVTPSAPCVRYIPGFQSFTISTSGWAAGAPLTFKIGGQIVTSGLADPTGALTTPAVSPPLFGKNVKSTVLTAEDGSGGVASSPVKVVKVVVDVPDRAKPSQRVKYRAFGFLPGKRVYLFVRRGGKTKGRFLLGKPRGDCGTLVKRLRYMPLRHWSTGTYEYWYAQSKRYSKKTRIYGYKINIFRTFR